LWLVRVEDNHEDSVIILGNMKEIQTKYHPRLRLDHHKFGPSRNEVGSCRMQTHAKAVPSSMNSVAKDPNVPG